MHTLKIERYVKHGCVEPMNNLVILNHWKDVYVFSGLFSDKFSVENNEFGEEEFCPEIVEYVYLTPSGELVEYLLTNSGGWKPNSTVKEQIEFLFLRFCNLFYVTLPWFRNLETKKLIKHSEDFTLIEFINRSAGLIMLSEFHKYYWALNNCAKDRFRESEEHPTKQQLLDHIKEIYKIP